jgi:hypothetical protein
MRTLLLLCVTLAVAGAFVQAQDPGMMAAQQASQQATMAAQQASQNAQMMSQSMQNASQTAQCYRCGEATPKFSLRPGAYTSVVTVRIKDAGRGAVIYYTTDGWTPTPASTRYTGPITISSTTTLQAIAVSPYGGRSRLATALYTLEGFSAPPPSAPSTTAATVAAPSVAAPSELTAPASSKRLLAQGTAVPLVFASDVNSKTAEVGDKISLALAEDLKVGDVMVARKGTAAVATVTEVDGKHVLGTPGEVFFQANSLQADGTVVKLRGGAAKEGQDKYTKAIALMVVPVPVPMALFVHGKDAEIKQGAVFTAFVDADTWLSAVE